jgi:hypothetical protein
MGWQIRTAAAALLALGASACASLAVAQTVLALGIPTGGAAVPMAPAQLIPIRALIGDQTLEASTHPAVISLAPVDYPYTPGAEIMLPFARPLLGGGSPVSCLTQAVYYEARSESLEGQRAVAQVVLNRTHEGHYPKSVCGVVFQGQERRTGCQFTFVCDGSRNGRIEPTAWDRARTVAEHALGGFEYTPLIGATHYHASWMTPYWSGSLTRMRQIGGHIFYR